MRLLILCVACFACFADSIARADQRAGVDFFETHIRPVLAKHCYRCHSEKARRSNNLQANLRLDTRAGLRQGGDSGPAIRAGDAGASLLISALRYESSKMPPKQKLPEAAIAKFVQWIEMGAPDPRTENANAPPLRKPVRDDRVHWSFQPLQKMSPPPTARSAWPRDPIDRFVLARLEQRKLSPAPDAEPHVLARRLHFDLIGLPPTPDELAAFEKEAAEDLQAAIGRRVDRLLASEHFGERWGRHWLDLVRYAETNGGDRNVIWPHAWRYRDYVIDAFNRDTPFDQFLREQIAGDLLPADSQEQRDRQRTATGMLTLGAKLFMETKAERFKMDVVDEQMEVVGRAVLALTISCARCHDHKFDAISTADYYALAGVFRSTYLLYGEAAPAGNQYGHDRPLQPIGKDSDKLVGPAEAWKKDVAEQTAARNKARSDRYRIVRKKAALENQINMLKKNSAPPQQLDDVAAEMETLAAEIKTWDEKIKQLDEKLQQTIDNPPRLPDYAMAVRDAEKPADCRIRIRGEYNQLGEAVTRRFLEAVPHQPTEIPAGQSGRLQLAGWLTEPRNPLTARVAVNRIWRHLFGEGLVRSVNNFGVAGERPSHRELLDYLAAEFQRDGWSVKRMIRRMALSRTYRQSSRHHAGNHAIDPANRWLWRMSRRRLEAEPLRDAMLSVSGALNRQRPQGSVISRDFAKERELNARVRLSDQQLRGEHRSIYLPTARMSLPATMRVWNFPDPSLIAGRRSERPTLDQQLFFLNSPVVIEHSAALASRVLNERNSDQERIRYCWRLAYNRWPSEEERRTALEYLRQNQKETEQAAWSMLCQALLASGEFRYLD